MSSHGGAAGVCGPSRVGDRGTEDASGESSNSEVEYTADALCSEVSPWLRSTDPGEGRSTVVKQLVRPPLPGRKAHRKSRSVDNGERDRGNLRERNQDRGEERESVESVGVKENVREGERQSQRKTERTETHGERLWDREGRGGTERLSSSNSDSHQSSAVDVVEGSDNLQTGLPCPRPHCIGQSLTSTTSTNPRSPRPAMSSMSPALPRPPIRTRPTPLSPQRLSPRTAAGELRRCPPHSSRQPDPFWVEVRTGAGIGWSSESHRIRTHIPSPTSSELGEEEEEEEEEEEGVEGEEEEEEEEGEAGGSGVVEVMTRTLTPAVALSSAPFAEGRMRKRERNRIKCLRRRQRRKERWRQSQLQESRQSSTGNQSSSEDDEDLSAGDREGYICAVCLDVYFSPYMCHPCNHIFCEPCLRTLAKNSPTNTPCPLCRTIITHVFFQKELNQTARTFFPREYLSRKQNFQKASCAKWPLPSCRKLFRIFGGFQRQSSPIARRQFPHGGGYRLDAMDFEDDSRGWRFDMDMVIIYIYSVNWVIGFFIFCFLCYLFFPSF